MHIEAYGVRDVEDLPTELQALFLAPGHRPPLRDTEVDAKEAVASNDIPLTRLTGVGRRKRINGSGAIGKDVDIRRAVIIEVYAPVFTGPTRFALPSCSKFVGEIAVAIVDVDWEAGGPAK